MPKLSDCLKQGSFSEREKILAVDISFVEGKVAESTEYLAIVEKAVTDAQLAEAWEDLPGNEGKYTKDEIKQMADAAKASRGDKVEALKGAKAEESLKPTSVKIDEKAPEIAEKVEAKESASEVEKPSITAEDGRAYILEDLASAVYKAGQTIKEFTVELKKKLGKSFEQIKGQVKELYEKVKAILAKPVTGGEVGAIGDKVEKEPTPKVSKTVFMPANEVNDIVDTPRAKSVLKKIQKLYTKKGISEKKTTRLIDKYEGLTQTLKDDKKDIFVKQKALEDHIKENLLGSERYKVLSHIKNISKPITEAGRKTVLAKAIVKVNEAHERYALKKAIAKVDKILEKKKPKKTRQGVQSNRSLDAETNRLLVLVREARGMSKPEALEKAAEIMERIDSGAPPSSEQRSKLEKMLIAGEITKEQHKEQAAELAEELQLDELAILSTFSGLKESTVAEVEKAVSFLESMIVSGRDAWRKAETARKEKMAELRDQFMKEVTGDKGLKTSEQERLEADKSIWRKAMEGLRSFDDLHQSFEFLLDKLARKDIETVTLKSKITEHFTRAAFEATENEHAGVSAHMEMFKSKMEEIFGKKKFAKKITENTKVVEKTGVTKNRGGKRVEIPLSQNHGYKLWQMFQQPSIVEEMSNHGYDDQTLTEVEGFVEADVMKWAEWQLDEFYPEYREGVNDIYKKRFYVDMPMIEGYTPVSRIYEGQTVDEAMLGEGGMNASLLASATKTRTDNSRDFNIVDGDSVLLKHVVELEHFKAWALAHREMRSVLGAESSQKAVKQYHGITANNVLKTFMDDFASGGIDKKNTLGVLDALRANFTVSAIGANPVVFLKQLASFPAYAQEIPVTDFVEGVAYAMFNPMKVYKTLMKTKTMQARGKTGWERDIMLAMRRSTPKTLSGKRTIQDIFMLPTRLGDRFPILVGGWAVYNYHLKKFRKEGKTEKQAEKEAAYQFGLATKRSQQSPETMDLAQMQRLGSLGKLFTMFMTSQVSYYRNSSAAIRNMTSGRGSLQDAKRLFISWALLSMTFQFIASGFDWDNEDQAKAILLGPLNGLFIVRDLLDNTLTALIKGQVFRSPSTPPPLTTIGKFSQAMLRINKMIREGYDEEEIAKVMKDIGEVAGNLTGIPVGPVGRVAEGVKDVIEGESDMPIRRSLGFKEKVED